MCKMTDAMSDRAVAIMYKIIRHPCAKLCLTINAGNGDETTSLSTIQEKLLTRRYVTVGEWRKDMKTVVSNIEDYNGKDSGAAKCAQTVFKLFEKEYKKFVSFSLVRWGQHLQELTIKLHSLMDMMASCQPDMGTIGSIGMSLRHNMCMISSLSAAESRAACRNRKVEMPRYSDSVMSRYPFLGSPIEPVWMSEPEAEEESHPQFSHEEVVTWHESMFYDQMGCLIGNFEEPEEEDFSEAAEPVFTSPEMSQPESPAMLGSRGKAPRQVSKGGKVPSMVQQKGRIKVKLNAESPTDAYSPGQVRRKPRTPPSPKKEIGDDEAHKRRGRGTGRRGASTRGRSRRGRSNYPSSSSSETASDISDEEHYRYEPPPPEEEIEAVPQLTEHDYMQFMQAVLQLNKRDDAQAMAMIILKNETNIDLGDQNPEVDLSQLRPITVYQLIQYTKRKLQGIGYSD